MNAGTGSVSQPRAGRAVRPFGGQSLAAGLAAGINRLRPSLFDVLLLAVPLWYAGMSDSGLRLLLADGDTGWHIRTGEWILQNRSFVHRDLFSFSKAGEPWFAWEWLADVLLALIHAAGGLTWVALLALAAGTAYCGLVLRHMLWQGARIWVALPLAFLGFSAASLHLLARPHLFTMLLVAAAAWWIQADLRHGRGRIWLMIPLTVVWTNLHGGWLALIVLLGLTALGLSVEAQLGRRRPAEAGRYALLTLACLLASLANPYGWRLLVHTAGYLQADFIRNFVGEFRAPSFRGERMLHYELVLLSSCAVAGLQLVRKQVVEPLWILFWAHASLQSARHIPLFAAVALPMLGAELQRGWDRWAAGRGRRSVAAELNELARQTQPELERMTWWPAAVLALFLAGVFPVRAIVDFPPERFPAGMVSRHERLLRGARLFTMDQWADYLIYRLHPDVKVFFDGRSDFYGRTIAFEYLDAINASHRWRQVLDRYQIDSVLLPPSAALATVLKERGDWRLVDDDGTAVLLRRRQPPPPQTGRRPTDGNSSLPAPNESP